MKNKTCGDCKHFYTSDEGHCSLKDDWGFTDSDACPDFKSKVVTNGDRIRQMSNGAFAFFMTRLILDGCPISKNKTMHGCKVSSDCVSCLKNWLNAPAESEVKDE